MRREIDWKNTRSESDMGNRAGEIPKKSVSPPSAHLMGPKNVPKKFGRPISSLAPPEIGVFKNARFIKQSALKRALISPGSWLFYEI